MKETLKSTKEYRIKLFPGSDKIADMLLRMAASSNGGTWFTIQDMQNEVEYKKALHTPEFDHHTAEIIGDKTLHLDIPAGGGEYKTILSIEEVELFETEIEVEDSDFEGLGGLAD